MATILVVGAGLAGCLAAVYAAQAGHSVVVFERRPDSRLAGYEGGRSINLALSRRGLHALQRVGLDEHVALLGIAMTGRLMHSVAGELTYQRYGRPGEANLSVSRQGLNELLIDAAERAGNVRFEFNSRIGPVNLENCVVENTRDGVTESVAGDLLIGADGAFSAVRLAMMRRDRFDYSQAYISHQYLELTVPPDVGGAFRMDPHVLHIWPRGSHMMIALPNLDGSFTCTLFLPCEGDGPSFESLRSESDGAEFLARDFPDLFALLGDAAAQWRNHRPASLSHHRCKPWAAGRALLIGDAAHAVVPFYGQGMNAAFEDCRLLFETLSGDAATWPAEIAAFARLRKPDADAISDLALANFHEMRASVADPNFLARKALEHVVSDHFPESYRPLYELVTYTDVPYSETQQIAAANDRLLDDPETRLGLLVLAMCRSLSQNSAGA